MQKDYWNKIYDSKSEAEVSWYQDIPKKSLELIAELGVNESDAIIDIGGGESRMVDHLLDQGFSKLSVLDISSTALEKTKERLCEKSSFVKFIVTDIRSFVPREKYQLWHDRATFHFLTSEEDILAYLEIANRAIAPGGNLIVSTFSKSGPEKCSGLPISQYSDNDLKVLFGKYFANIRCLEDTHKTPWGTGQNFVYCGFKKR